MAERLQRSQYGTLHERGETLADLSFAALMAPALGVNFETSGGVVRMPPPERLGAEYAEKAAAWRAHDEVGSMWWKQLARRDAIAVTLSLEDED